MDIHTFELTKELSHNEFKDMRKALKRKNFSSGKNKSKIEIDKYSNYGIRIYLMNHKYYPCIRFIVNPTAVLDNGNVTDLFSASDKLAEVARLFDAYISELFGSECLFEDLKLTRLDLCTDLQLSSHEEVREYIHLLYKSNMKKGYKVKGRKCENYDTKIGFACDNPTAGIGISIYDKKSQLLNIGKLNAAKKVGSRLRIEVQLKSQKSLRKYCEYDSSLKQIRYFLDQDQTLAADILNKLLIDADYHTLPEAIDEVCERKSGKIRDRMIRLLELTSTHHGIRSAVKALKLEEPSITDKYVKILLQSFRDINVNVVTLGKRSNVKLLKSLLARI